jgi:hypothetical protein
MDINERMDYIDFRMNLMREGTDFAKYIYDCEITEEQLKRMYDIMDSYRTRIDNREEVSSVEYEADILSIVDRMKHDYHFCESFARLLWEDERYEEVFEALYKDSQKFYHLFNK